MGRRDEGEDKARRRANLARVLSEVSEIPPAPSLRREMKLKVAQELSGSRNSNKAAFPEYADDPVGFARDKLKIERLTADQITLMEAVVNYPIVVALSATGVGKTYVLSLIALWFYFCREAPQVWSFAAPPESNLRHLLWGEMYTRVNENPVLFEGEDVRSSMLIRRAPKEFIIGVPIPRSASEEDVESSFSGKHAPSLLFLGDEADAIPDAVFRGVDGCLSGGFARMVLCLNPKRKYGMVWDYVNTGKAHVVEMGAFSHVNVRTGRDEIPGAVTREKTVQRINEWAEPLPPDEEVDSMCFELPQFLEGAVASSGSGVNYPPLQPGWYRIIDGQLATKVLGRYPPAGTDQLIHDRWIEEAQTKWEAWRAMHGGAVVPPEGIQPAMTFDVAGGGPDGNVVILRYGTWFSEPITWGGVDSDLAAQKGARLYAEHQAKIAYVDASGVGNGAAQKMQRMVGDEEIQAIARTQGRTLSYINAIPVDTGEKSVGWSEEGQFMHIRDEAYWALRLAFKEGNIMIPPANRSHACKKLEDALKKLTYEVEGSYIRIVKKRTMINRLGGESPDEADALMLHFVPASTWFGGV